MKKNKIDKSKLFYALYTIAIILLCVFFVGKIIYTNNNTKDIWNNGICPNDNTRYVLSDYNRLKGIKTYICPECGNEVKRY